MSKSILVIDTPKSCTDCDIFNHEQLCCLGYKVNFGELSKVQSWCPLKPVPKRIGSASEYGCDEVYIKHLINWKKEIDEILGDTDNE